MLATAPLLLPLLLLATTVLSPPAALAANILVFMPMPLKSHFGGFQPMFEELALRGHNVTVVSAFPLTNRRVPNYTDVDVTPAQGFLGEHTAYLYPNIITFYLFIRTTHKVDNDN